MSPPYDLVVLVADADIEQTIHGLLSRTHALGIAAPNYAIYKHPNRDGGCRTDAHNVLRPFTSSSRFALVVFDREGSGGEPASAEEIEAASEQALAKNGWGDRAKTIVIDPEIEQWVWNDSRAVDQILGWNNLTPNLKNWLTAEGFYAAPDQTKPASPKDAFLKALRESKKKPSASLFRQLAERVNFRNCQDRAFLKLQQTLQAWFSSGS